MSPSNNSNADKASDDKSSNLVIPFPSLPVESPQKHSHRKRHLSKSNDRIPTASAPISFPKNHIHRTPSELQFENSLIQAEQSDIIMYSRLVRGMAERGASLQSSDQHQQGHLLSRKSLMGVLESRQKPVLEDDQEEEGHDVSPTGDAEGKTVDHASQPNSAANVNADTDCDFGYYYEETRAPDGAMHDDYSMHSRRKSDHQDAGHVREVSTASSNRATDDEEECVFPLEM